MRFDAFVLGVSVAAAGVAAGTQPASAANPIVAVSSSPNAPVQTFGCGISGEWIAGWYLSISAFNRTDARLASFTARLRAYDRQTTKIWDAETPIPDAKLDSGEAADYPNLRIGNLSFDKDRTAKIVCSITAATLGSKTWTSPHPWPGKLLALHRAKVIEGTSSAAAPSSAPAAVAALPAASTAVAVAQRNVWISRTPQGAFVHVRLALTASHDVTVHSSDFFADVALPAGGSKAFAGLGGPAPLVLKPGFAAVNGAISTARSNDPNSYERAVKPDDDLGAIGALSLKGGQSAVTIVTFDIPEAMPVPGNQPFALQTVEFRPARSAN